MAWWVWTFANVKNGPAIRLAFPKSLRLSVFHPSIPVRLVDSVLRLTERIRRTLGESKRASPSCGNFTGSKKLKTPDCLIKQYATIIYCYNMQSNHLPNGQHFFTTKSFETVGPKTNDRQFWWNSFFRKNLICQTEGDLRSCLQILRSTKFSSIPHTPQSDCSITIATVH